MMEGKRENSIPRLAYREFYHDIAQYNIRVLRQVSLGGTIIGTGLVIASLPPIHLFNLLGGYCAFLALFVISLLLSLTVLKKHERAVLPIYYILILFVMFVAIIMGTFWGVDTNATTFVMFIMVFPMLIIDRPVRLTLTISGLCIIFCIVVCNVKEGLVLQLDVANSIIFSLLSIAISNRMINTKMSDIIIKHELKTQRDMDMLTKLSNRGVFERVVAQYIHESNKNAVLLIMDIDDFKKVNDNLGHASGDMVLQRVGEYLQSAFRSGDTVSRLGGDEFVAFLPAVEEIDIIVKKAEDLIRRISEMTIDQGSDIKIGASIGISQYPDNGCSFEELYKRADVALYNAKEQGKNRCAVYCEDE